MKDILVMSRRSAIDYVAEQREHPFYVISIHSWRSDVPEFDKTNPMLMDVLDMEFSDVLCDEPHHILPCQAIEIIEFAKKVPDDATLLIHCRAGVSRSSAAAAALSLIFFGDDSKFWEMPYCPNETVYTMILTEDFKMKLEEQLAPKLRKNVHEYMMRHDNLYNKLFY